MGIKRYRSFLSDRLLESLLLESKINFSKDFMDLLNNIDSKVSNIVLGMGDKDFKTDVNFIDIDHDSSDTINFTADKKAQEILGDRRAKIMGGGFYLSATNSKLFTKFGFDNPDSEQTKLEAGTHVSVKDEISSSRRPGVFICFVMTDDGRKALVNKNNIEFTRDKNDVWKKYRNIGKIGRFVRKLITMAGEKVLDKDIEDFVNKWKAQWDLLHDAYRLFQVVKGEDIRKFYHQNRYYVQSSGTLGNSCMQYKDCQPFFDPYCLNPDKVSMLIFRAEKDEEKIVGRAIIWKLDNGDTFMDRIYTINDSDVNLFKDYAKKNRWAFKESQNGNNMTSLDVPGEGNKRVTGVKPDLKITLGSSYRYFPYMDTMKYFNRETHLLSNLKLVGCGSALDGTGGNGYDEDEECDYCHGNGTVDCDDCNGNGKVECSNCSGRGDIRCSDCSGKGKVECGDCDGAGHTLDSNGNEIECVNCDGAGEVDCDECGKGRVDCDECSGDGGVNCDNCGGDGTVDCPECN